MDIDSFRYIDTACGSWLFLPLFFKARSSHPTNSEFSSQNGILRIFSQLPPHFRYSHKKVIRVYQFKFSNLLKLSACMLADGKETKESCVGLFREEDDLHSLAGKESSNIYPLSTRHQWQWEYFKPAVTPANSSQGRVQHDRVSTGATKEEKKTWVKPHWSIRRVQLQLGFKWSSWDSWNW